MCASQRFIVLAALAAVGQSASLRAGSFNGCGELFNGVECVLFAADSGGVYLLENRAGFGPGDRVHVAGDLVFGCVSFCQEEDACIFENTIGLCEPGFTGCGTLVQGVECVVFAADSGGTFALANLGGFGVGDRVRVSGALDPDCVTFCNEGDGCIESNTIRAVCLGDVDCDLDVDLSDLAQLLAHFGTQAGASPADGDLDGDEDVDLSDLSQMLGRFGANC